MSLESAPIFKLEYPSEAAPLYPNVNVASGWCFHPTEKIRGIELRVNGLPHSEAALGQPRIDVASKYMKSGHASLLSGFNCYFDYESLEAGPNVFEFDILTRSSTKRHTYLVERDTAVGPKVSDVFVDIVGPCNLRCAMCPQGGPDGPTGQRGRGVMSVELFDRTLRYLREALWQGEYVNLYNWGDPLLHPDLGEILDTCRVYGVKPIVSTNLSFPAERIAALRQHGLELLLVSLSGFSEPTYRRNHIGGDFKRIRRILEILSSDRGLINSVVLKYLVFDYNSHELQAAKEFAERKGFEFGAYRGAIPSADDFFRYEADVQYRNYVHQYISLDRSTLKPARFCPQETSITLNHQAQLELCCVSWNSGFRKSLFETNVAEYLKNKVKNEFCDKCLHMGYSHYKHFGVLDPTLLALAST